MTTPRPARYHADGLPVVAAADDLAEGEFSPMTDRPLLDRLRSPADLRGMELGDLERLAAELRGAILDAVSANGGHLASNLGVVELTIALHRTYDFGPHPVGPDKLLLDVGHQCYPHKMLTGRAGDFPHLRQAGHVGGFPMPDESPYDLFAVGHAGTAISTAVGVARGDQMQGKASHVVAVVGDASIVNGLALEGLNNAGTLKRQLLVVLNDNGMSISRPQGAFGEYLERVRVSTTYDEFKRVSKKVVGQFPGSVGAAVGAAWEAVRSGVKGAMWAGQMFESMGLQYMGPVDGHDLPGLLNFLAEIKHVDRPVLLHVKTRKGFGLDAALADPTTLHSPAAFDLAHDDEGCRVTIRKGTGKSWTAAFADALIAAADDDDRVVGLTAAMPDGTGLSKFEQAHPGRYLDTGICESHLCAMAAGMAKTGLRPVAAVYSTFTQRLFDQAWQEVALNGLPVVLAMDRAGFVGDDGAVHHGFCDQAFLRPLPGIVLMAPSDEADLGRMLRLALSLDAPSAIRYPRDVVPPIDHENVVAADLAAAARAGLRLGQSRTLRTGTDATIVAYGALASNALAAAELLQDDGLDVAVVDARFCKPLDGAMLARVLSPGHPVLTVEDHGVTNGFGTAVAEHAVARGLPTADLTLLGHPADRLVAHAKRDAQLAEVGLDAAGIIDAVRRAVTSARAPTRRPAGSPALAM